MNYDEIHTETVSDDKTIIEETVLFFKDGDHAVAKLADAPEEILSVANPVKNDEVDLSRIKICGNALSVDSVKAEFREEWLTGKNLPEDLRQDERFKLGVFLPIPADLVSYQYKVAYRAKNKRNLPTLTYYDENLNSVKRKIKNGENVTVLLYGDSISNAANSSGDLNLPPYEKPWYVKALGKISERCGCKINFINNSRSGYGSDWGADAVKEKVLPIDCDLFIIAFGMNDATAATPVEKFEKNIRDIANAKPNSSIILVSSILPNAESDVAFYDLRFNYRRALDKICREKSYALMDMTAISEYFIGKKRYAEISGNNFNHPNDFIYNFYTRALYDALNG